MRRGSSSAACQEIRGCTVGEINKTVSDGWTMTNTDKQQMHVSNSDRLQSCKATTRGCLRVINVVSVFSALTPLTEALLHFHICKHH